MYPTSYYDRFHLLQIRNLQLSTQDLRVQSIYIFLFLFFVQSSLGKTSNPYPLHPLQAIVSPRVYLCLLLILLLLQRLHNLPIQGGIHPLQHHRTPSHDHGTKTEEPDPTRKIDFIENRVGIEIVVAVALLDPEPVAECDTCT